MVDRHPQTLDVQVPTVQHCVMRRSVLLVGLSALMPLCARAQDVQRLEPNPRVSAALGVHYGSPMRISLAGGVLVDVSERRSDGVVVMAEAGQQGDEV